MDAMIITDLLTGRNIRGYYKEYNKTQWFSRDEIENYQLNKLKLLIKHCYCNVPYYTKIMKDGGIDPNNVRDIAYVKQFPILSKEIIKDNYDLFTPINSNNIRGMKTSQTSGTTGSILFKRNDANTRSSVWGSYRRFYDWMGISPGGKVLSYWGGHVINHSYVDSVKKLIANYAQNNIGFDAYDPRDTVIEKIAKTLSKQNVQLIRSYPQALYGLALKLKEKGWTFRVKAILTTSEPLMPQQRSLFKEVFGADTFDQYGCGEIGAIAYECPVHNGLHVTEERVLVEVNSERNLIITDLDNFSMPFIRYWNADEAEVSDLECSCGRKSKVLKSILGRTCDYLIVRDGQRLHWGFFLHLLFDTNIAVNRNFVKFQVVQDSRESLLFRTVSDPLSEDDKKLLTQKISERMGEMKVSFILEQDIENSKSGKYRPVINKLL
jgi:phenylacetate-CoA ligase